MAQVRGEGTRLARKVGGLRIVGSSLLLGVALAVTSAPSAGAAGPAPCRVRNLTQDTSGRSLISMVEQADDGDVLQVRGTCPGPVAIKEDIVIRGMGVGPAITGRYKTRGVQIARNATVTLRDITIRKGRAPGPFAGGLRNVGTLTLIDVAIRQGRADHGGGGIVNLGELTVRESIVAANTAADSGGGIFNVGTLALIDSRVSSNRAGYGGVGGGGILNRGTLSLIDSRVSSNRADNGGGIANVRDTSSVTLDGSTISGNVAAELGGGIYNEDTSETEGCAGAGRGGIVTLIDSTVTGNTAGSAGGGIYNTGDDDDVGIDGTSSVTGNTPDDCVGTPAC